MPKDQVKNQPSEEQKPEKTTEELPAGVKNSAGAVDVGGQIALGAAPILGASETVSIVNGDSVDSINTRITAAITKAAETATSDYPQTVVVDGEKHDVTQKLDFTISSNVTVQWKAVYTGNAGSNPSALFFVRGPGELEVVNGGEINATGNGDAVYLASKNAFLTVNGGTISAVDGAAIYTLQDYNPTIIISAGTVFTTGSGNVMTLSRGYPLGNVIISVTVCGTGRVMALGSGNAMYSYGTSIIEVKENAVISATSGRAIDGSKVTVEGGTVSSQSGDAIYAGNTTIKGGTVSSESGHAIYGPGAGHTITVSDGLIFAYGNDIIGDGDVIYGVKAATGPNPEDKTYGTYFEKPTGSGVIIAFDKAAYDALPDEEKLLESGSSDHLKVLSADGTEVTAVWARQKNEAGDIVYGIAYQSEDGSIQGFMPLSSSTVKVVPAPESTPNASLDYVGEMLTELTPGTYLFTVDEGEPFEVTIGEDEDTYSLASLLDGTTGVTLPVTLSIVKKGDGIETGDSAAQDFTIPARPDAPTGITARAETVRGQGDGQIIVTEIPAGGAIEYKSATAAEGAEWTSFTGPGTTIAGLAPGSYLVRLAATDDAFASAAVTVTIRAGSAPVYTYALTVVNGVDATNAGPYRAGTVVRIAANAAVAGQVFDQWVSNGGGAFADASSAATTFTMPAGAATVTATYKDAPLSGGSDDNNNNSNGSGENNGGGSAGGDGGSTGGETGGNGSGGTGGSAGGNGGSVSGQAGGTTAGTSGGAAFTSTGTGGAAAASVTGANADEAGTDILDTDTPLTNGPDGNTGNTVEPRASGTDIESLDDGKTPLAGGADEQGSNLRVILPTIGAALAAALLAFLLVLFLRRRRKEKEDF